MLFRLCSYSYQVHHFDKICRMEHIFASTVQQFNTVIPETLWRTTEAFAKCHLPHCFVALVLLHLFSEFCKTMLGRSRSRGRCWAAIRLSHRPEPSGGAIHGEVDGLDIGEQHGRRFVLLPYTHRLLSRTHRRFLGGSFRKGGCRCRGWMWGVS